MYIVLKSSMQLTFQTKTRSTWFNNARRSNLLRLWSPRLHGDSSTRDSPNLHQRQTLCAMPTCFTCSSPSYGNHVQNLTTALNTTTSTTTVNTRPAPPTSHWISELTRSFQDAILINNLNTFYDHCMVSEPDILKFDWSQLLTTLKLAQKIIDSSISPSPTPT